MVESLERPWAFQHGTASPHLQCYTKGWACPENTCKMTKHAMRHAVLVNQPPGTMVIKGKASYSKEGESGETKISNLEPKVMLILVLTV